MFKIKEELTLPRIGNVYLSQISAITAYQKDSVVYVALSTKGSIVIVSIDTGEIIWKCELFSSPMLILRYIKKMNCLLSVYKNNPFLIHLDEFFRIEEKVLGPKVKCNSRDGIVVCNAEEEVLLATCFNEYLSYEEKKVFFHSLEYRLCIKEVAFKYEIEKLFSNPLIKKDILLILAEGGRILIFNCKIFKIMSTVEVCNDIRSLCFDFYRDVGVFCTDSDIGIFSFEKDDDDQQQRGKQNHQEEEEGGGKTQSRIICSSTNTMISVLYSFNGTVVGINTDTFRVVETNYFRQSSRWVGLSVAGGGHRVVEADVACSFEDGDTIFSALATTKSCKLMVIENNHMLRRDERERIEFLCDIISEVVDSRSKSEMVFCISMFDSCIGMFRTIY